VANFRGLGRAIAWGFGTALGRRIAGIVVLLLLALVGANEARAQSATPTCPNGAGCSRQQAWASCEAVKAYWRVNYSNQSGRDFFANNPCHDLNPSTSGTVAVTRLSDGARLSSPSGQSLLSYYSYICPANSNWNETTKQCDATCPPGEVMNALTGQCQSCLSRNGAANGFPDIVQSKSFLSKCLNGCTYEAQGDKNACVSVGGIGNQQVCTGVFQFTGGTCGAQQPQPPPPPEPDPPKEQECIPNPNGLTVCQKRNGDQCYTGSTTGRQICWTPGETGQKTDGNTQQERTPGQTTPPETKSANNGDSLTQNGTAWTTTTTTNGTTVITIVTTTTNYQTGSGADAGPGNDGEDVDDDGQPVPGSGNEDDGDGTSESGGQDCDTPPVVTGDNATAAVVKQAWYTRCAVEKYGKVVSTGDVGDCNSAFTVEGDNAMAKQLRAKRIEICGPEGMDSGDASFDQTSIAGDDDGQGNGFALEGDGTGGEIDQEPDDSGYGFSRTCPTIPAVQFMGNTIQFDNSVMCDWLALGGQFVLALAALASLRIMAGGGGLG
jgi:hypothetical protein